MRTIRPKWVTAPSSTWSVVYVWRDERESEAPASAKRYSVSDNLSVDAAGTSGTLQALDWMGNASTVAYSNGVATLNQTEMPMYVV